MPTLNEAAGIAAAVEQAWRLGPLEVIVADGGSPDATARLAAEAGARVIETKRSRGAQLNAGARIAIGEVILFLHADTHLDERAADQIAQALSNPKVVWGAFRQRIDADGWLYRALERGNAYRARRMHLAYGDQAIFVRKAALEKIGGVPEQPLLEDAELSRRLRRLAPPVLLEGPLIISARRWRRHGVIRQTIRNWVILALWRLGVPPARLAKLYRPHKPAQSELAQEKSIPSSTT